ncbi:MAG: ABC transporter permease [Lachnospiraceae bacterium]|nr:ABC transporter permease [Lachnospiraceae bacterium]
MYKIFFIAKNNIKRQKGDMITFLILTCLSAILIFDCLSALLGLEKVLDDRFEEVNGAEIYMWVRDNDKAVSSADKAFSESTHIVKYEKTPAAELTADYRNLKDDEYETFDYIFQDFNNKNEIMNIKMPDMNLGENDIVIPFNLKNSFEIGDTFELKSEDKTFRFNVAGFSEDPIFCSTMNISTHSMYISDTKMKELDGADIGFEKGFVYKGITDREVLEHENLDLADIEKEVADIYKMGLVEWEEKNPEIAGDPKNVNRFGGQYMLVNWDTMRSGDQIIPKIIMAVVLLFALMVLAIALIIISFSIRNFIRRNMKNTGILEAGGYTVRQLKTALVLQVTMVACLGSAIGLAIAIGSFNYFGDVLSFVIGLSWNQPVNWIVALTTFFGLSLMVCFVTLIIGRQYNRITVLDALRGGITTHNYRKNLFSFENTPAPIPVVLSLKDTFGGLGKNILLSFIIFMLSIFTIVGFGLNENFGRNPEGMVKMMGFEVGNIIVSGDNGVADDIRALPEVSSVFCLSRYDMNLIFNGITKQYNVYVHDDPTQTTNTNIIEGRLPENDNEIMVTAAIAEDLSLKVGDVIEVENAGKKGDYLVVGINQRMEQYGRTGIMSLAAAEKLLTAEPHFSIYVTGNDGETFESLKAKIEEIAKNKGLTLQYTDSQKTMETTIVLLVSTMKALCLVICVVTLLVVVFVESLVIRAKISREWRGMGISKALGQTSGGLISQIMLSNMPAILAGGIIGAVLADFVGGFGVETVFSGFGIKRVCFDIPFIYMLATVAGIMLVAIITSGLAGLKVRKLNPVEMITEE